MALSAAGLNAAVNGVKAQATYVSMHTGDPGTTGANEVTGGSPAYARKGASWGTAANGVVTLSSALQFDIPAGVTVTHFGSWSAAAAGTFVGGDALRDNANNPVSENFGSQGFYTLTTASITVTN